MTEYAPDENDRDKDIGGYDTCFATDDPKLIARARQLVAQVYLMRGFIKQEWVDEDGCIKPEHDPHHEHATYYVMTTPDKEDVVATLRVIRYDERKGEDSFPLLEHKDELDGERREELIHIGYENLLEISALVRDKELDPTGVASMKLYRHLFLDAWSQDDEGKSTFIMACNPRLYERFALLFGESMKRLGPDLSYPGQEAVPAMFSNKDGALGVIGLSKDRKNPYNRLHKDVVEYFLHGSDATKLYPEVIDALRAYGYDDLLQKMTNLEWEYADGYDEAVLRRMTKSGAVGKVREYVQKRWLELSISAGLIGWTVPRAIGVEYGISSDSTVPFVAVELATTPTYAWPAARSIRAAVSGKDERSTRQKNSDRGLIAGSIIAPYAYLYATGATETSSGRITLAGLAATAAVPGLVKAVKKRRQKKSSGQQDDGEGV